MKNWKVGDRAIVIKAKHAELIGTIVTITSELTDRSPQGNHWEHGGTAHMVDIPSMENPPWPAAFEAEHLGLIPDNKSTWAAVEKDCLWNPTKVTVTVP